MRIILLITLFISTLTLVGKSNYAFKKLCQEKYDLVEKEISKESNEKETNENSKEEKSSQESKTENYYLNTFSTLLFFNATVSSTEIVFQETFFENHTTDVKDNPPDLS